MGLPTKNQPGFFGHVPGCLNPAVHGEASPLPLISKGSMLSFASEMTYIVSSGALNSTHSLTSAKSAKSLRSAKSTVICRSVLDSRWKLVLPSHRKQETRAARTICHHLLLHRKTINHKHNLKLPTNISQLTKCNFIKRMLFFNVYWLLTRF